MTLTPDSGPDTSFPQSLDPVCDGVDVRPCLATLCNRVSGQNASASPGRGQGSETSLPVAEHVTNAVGGSSPPKHTLVTSGSGSGDVLDRLAARAGSR